MNVYVDTSIILRRLLRDPHPIAGWGRWSQAFSSRLWQTEAMRAVHRLRLEGRIRDGDVVRLFEDVSIINQCLVVIPVTEDILSRAGEAMPTMVGTLDAIHLTSAMTISSTIPIDRFLTHDKQLAVAARSMGFAVDGVDS